MERSFESFVRPPIVYHGLYLGMIINAIGWVSKKKANERSIFFCLEYRTLALWIKQLILLRILVGEPWILASIYDGEELFFNLGLSITCFPLLFIEFKIF